MMASKISFSSWHNAGVTQYCIASGVAGEYFQKKISDDNFKEWSHYTQWDDDKKCGQNDQVLIHLHLVRHGSENKSGYEDNRDAACPVGSSSFVH